MGLPTSHSQSKSPVHGTWANKSLGKEVFDSARSVFLEGGTASESIKALEIFERLGTLIEPDKVRKELEGLPA